MVVDVQGTRKDWQDVANGFRFSPDEVRTISQNFCRHIEWALAGKQSSLSALRTYAPLPTGKENGTFMALDVGGTNVRASRITLRGDGRYIIESMVTRPLRSAEYDYTTAQTGADTFFDFVVSVIKEAAGMVQQCMLGVTFSFAVTQTSLSDATLLSWSKEIAVPGVVGTSVMTLLKEALGRCGLRHIIPVALVNDTTATLLSAVYRGQPSRIGIVCGTGFNMCYEESALGMIVNLEAAGFTGVPKTRWDIRVDTNSQRKGDHGMEKMVSGRYISDVYRYALEDWLGRAIPAMTTKDMNRLVQGTGRVETSLLGVLSPTEVEGARGIGRAIFYRSAQLIGAAAFGILLHLYVDETLPPQALSMEGSLVSHIEGMKEGIGATIHTLCNTMQKESFLSVIVNDGGPSLGAAIAASLKK